MKLEKYMIESPILGLYASWCSFGRDIQWTAIVENAMFLSEVDAADMIVYCGAFDCRIVRAK